MLWGRRGPLPGRHVRGETEKKEGLALMSSSAHPLGGVAWGGFFLFGPAAEGSKPHQRGASGKWMLWLLKSRRTRRRPLQRPREERGVAPRGMTEVETFPFAALPSCFSSCLTSARAEGSQGGSSTGGKGRQTWVWKGRTGKGRGILKLKSSRSRIVVKRASTLNFRTDPPATLALSFHLSRPLRKST